MTDIEPQDAEAEQSPTSLGTEESVTSPLLPEKRTAPRWHTIWRVFVISIVIFIALIAAGGWFLLIREKPKLEIAIDDALSAMRDQDVARAYLLLSSRARENVSLSDIENALAYADPPYEDYESVDISSIELLSWQVDDPSLPNETTAYVDGAITYAGDVTMLFVAELEMEAGEWRLVTINIGPPVEEPSQ